MRNIPMEKLARSYFEKVDVLVTTQRSRSSTRRGSCDLHHIRAVSQPPPGGAAANNKDNDW